MSAIGESFVSLLHRGLRGALFAVLLAVPLAQAAPIEVKVMTRNLYQGVDLAPVIAAILADDPNTSADDALVGLAVGAAWLKVVASDPKGRMDRIAGEILSNMPHVVGLQEASLWQTRTPSALFTPPGAPLAPLLPTFDFFGELQTALAGSYTLVTSLGAPPVGGTGFAPGLLPPTDIVLIDRSGILVRNDVALLGFDTFAFNNLFTVPGLGLPVVRGINWVDLGIGGETLRVTNSHLESTHPGINLAQSQELVDFLATSPSHRIALGDFNSVVEPFDNVFIPTGSDQNLRNNGYSDAWLDKGTGPGFTCCNDELLSNPGAGFTHRIDYVFHRGFETIEIERTGVDPDVATPPLWPSDHAGLVATLQFVPAPGSLPLLGLALVVCGIARRVKPA
jgi:hypothetical protein